MKLLYLHHLPLTGGKANALQVMHMCQAFQQAGAEVVLAVPHADGVAPGAAIERELGQAPGFRILGHRQRAVGGRARGPASYWGMRSLLGSAGDVDCCFTRNPLLARLAVRHGFKTIYEAHDERLHPSRLLNRWYVRSLVKVARRPECVRFVTISRALAEIWQARGVPGDKLLVLHDGVALEQYEPALSRDEARSRLGLAPGGKLVVYAGSLYDDRDVGTIVRLAASFPDARFLVVGGPDHRKVVYEAMARRAGRGNVAFVGRVPHCRVSHYLFAGDVLLMLWSWEVPTIRICSPLKVFEYMAAGRIIVGPGFPTITEVLTDGATALLATPGSDAALEGKLREALSLTYPNAMAAGARQLALARHTWTRRAATILDALDSRRAGQGGGSG